MTTICTDGDTIAADSQITQEGVIDSGGTQKMIKKGDIIFAFSGCLPLFTAWVQWWKDGKDPEKLPVANEKMAGMAMWVFEEGNLWEVVNEAPYPVKIKAPNAIGSGREFALGAMYAGKSPKEAVEIACKLDAGSGGGVQVIPLPIERNKENMGGI